jgi:hypothetical protein
MADLLIAAVLVVAAGIGLRLMAGRAPSASRRYPTSAGAPYRPEPKRRDDFTLIN